MADLVIQWDRYMLCSRPINVWTMTSYLNVASFRILQHISEEKRIVTSLSLVVPVCHHLEELDDDEYFFSITSSERWQLKALQYGVVFPALVGWTVLGTCWISDIARQTPHCVGHLINLCYTRRNYAAPGRCETLVPPDVDRSVLYPHSLPDPRTW